MSQYRVSQFFWILVAFAITILTYNQVALSNIPGPNVVVSYKAGQTTLTSSDRQLLNQLVNQARAKGDDSEIQVAVWSDNPTPRPGESLSKADQTLVDSRTKAIRSYLKEALKFSKVSFYNMAEQSNWLARFFSTTESELKSEMQPNRPLSNEEFRVFRDYGQSSRAVFLVKYSN